MSATTTTTTTTTTTATETRKSPGITYKPLHPTIVAEASGVDFNNITPEVVQKIKEGLAKYGVLVFRKTGLDDARHVAMSKLFGELDDITPYTQMGRINRLPFDELFDVANIEADGSIMQPGSPRWILGNGNSIFHVDSAFNPRRAGYSLLRAHVLPPPGYGGNTEFADTRTAYQDLPSETKERIKDYVTNNSQHHSRRVASPDAELLKDPKFDPLNHEFAQHRLVQLHEASGRMNLYIANHAHSIVGMPLEEGQKEIRALLAHASQPKYTVMVEWNDPGDLVIWDNTCVMHRAVPGLFDGKYMRDMRRTTVHDGSSYAWGMNEVGATWRSGLP